MSIVKYPFTGKTYERVDVTAYHEDDCPYCKEIKMEEELMNTAIDTLSEHNRNLSYAEIVQFKGLTGQMEAVFKTIFDHPNSSDSEIAELCGISRSSVNGRRDDLMKEGLVMASGSKYDRNTDRHVTTWKVCSDGKSEKKDERYLTNAEMKKLESLIYKLKSNDHKFQTDKIRKMLE